MKTTLAPESISRIVESTPGIQVSPILTKRIFPEFKKRYLRAINRPVQVFYPFCRGDISPLEVFGRDVIYLDADVQAIRAMYKEGLDAYTSNPLEFSPQRGIDLLLLINSPLDEENTKKLVAKVSPSFVMCDNINGAQDYLRRNHGFKFAGKIESDYSVFQKKIIV